MKGFIAASLHFTVIVSILLTSASAVVVHPQAAKNASGLQCYKTCYDSPLALCNSFSQLHEVDKCWKCCLNPNSAQDAMGSLREY
ncbi:hypothetical protein BDQ12DRAFT_686302 [Crucibulum laeve]|uniref:Uncharacterized protein n=1 Tax=Crucibulum laeve TaxID=68775 RepID=A0A5C3LXN9_9AGAR|nr:hypothetical protein BDQ12DRAFT_686302 [Crucibulum laeve]